MEKQSEKLEQEYDFQLRQVGTSVQRIDAQPKVTGKVVYARDMVIPFMLHGKVKRSPYAHARILSIDYSKAMEISGVIAVATGRDFPSLGTVETPAMARDEILYPGQAVVAVAAENKVIAEEALNANLADYKVLTAVDMPRIETVIFGTPSGEGPFGARGAGEGSTLDTAPAIRNAICDATGAPINKIPIRPCDIVMAISKESRRR